MSVIGTYPIELEQNADQTALVFKWYPNATLAQVSAGTATPQDLTGYTMTMMVRVNIADASPAATYTLTAQGGGSPDTTGTVQMALTHTQTSTLYGLLPVGQNDAAYGWYDVLLVSPGNVNTRFIDHSQIKISPAVTR